MSEQNDLKFDRKVREMMQDAREDVPGGVWEGISSRIRPHGGNSSSWLYTGLGLAVAAALGAVLFLTGTKTGTPVEENGIAVVSPLPADGGDVVPALSSEGTFDVPSNLMAALAPSEREPEKPLKKEILKPGAPKIAGSRDEQPGKDNKVVEKSVEGKRAEPVHQEVRKKAVRPDAFKSMEFEEVRKAGKKANVSIDLRGSMTGSESAASPSASRSGSLVIPDSQQILTEESVSTYGIPFTLGAGVRFEILPGFSIGTGLDYSFLSRTFSATYVSAPGAAPVSGDVRHSMHYLGIPVKLFYNLIDRDSFLLYVNGGGKAEFCLSNTYAFSSGNIRETLSSPVSSPQFSVNLGLGVEFRLSEHFGIYLDPGVRYYFYGKQPKSFRTEKPFMFDLSAGVRFRL